MSEIEPTELKELIKSMDNRFLVVIEKKINILRCKCYIKM